MGKVVCSRTDKYTRIGDGFYRMLNPIMILPEKTITRYNLSTYS